MDPISNSQKQRLPYPKEHLRPTFTTFRGCAFGGSAIRDTRKISIVASVGKTRLYFFRVVRLCFRREVARETRQESVVRRMNSPTTGN